MLSSWRQNKVYAGQEAIVRTGHGTSDWFQIGTSWQIDGETMETVTNFISWAPKSLQMVTAAMKLKDTYSLEEKL